MDVMKSRNRERTVCMRFLLGCCNVLKLDRGDDYKVLNISLNDIKWMILWFMSYISIKLLKIHLPVRA